MGIRTTMFWAAGAALAVALSHAAPAKAQTTTAEPAMDCPPRAMRWQEDCRSLAGRPLQGLDRLRYRELTGDGDVWLTLGGEAKSRLQGIDEDNFGIGGGPSYVSLTGRLLLHGDLHLRDGPRAFVQLGVAAEHGRRPRVRSYEQSELDVVQAFVDVPLALGEVETVARLGRQELDLSGNRLVLPRDGASLPRTFEGVRVDTRLGATHLAVASLHTIRHREDAFADRADKSERFNALSLDLPSAAAGGGAVNLFLFDRRRANAEYLRASGKERRYSAGARYVGRQAGWLLDAQGTWQFGEVDGLSVRAWGWAVGLDKRVGDVELSLDLIAASGDRGGTRKIESFDPVYPNNAGLAVPLIYQTNYVYAGGGASRQWAGVTWTGTMHLVTRQSASDAIYANGEPMNGAFGGDRMTSVLSQISLRRRFGHNFEVYGRLAHAKALGGVTDAGGHDAVYGRVDLTARF